MPTLKCRHCDKDLNDGKAYWSVNLSKEKMEGHAITVLQADSVVGLCLACAELYELNSISIPLEKRR